MLFSQLLRADKSVVRAMLHGIAANGLSHPAACSRAGSAEVQRAGSLYLPVACSARSFVQVVLAHCTYRTTLCKYKVQSAMAPRGLLLDKF